MFNSKQYEYADITLELGGRVVTGARGVKYSSKQEKELVYAKGNEPQHIQRGNLSYEGEITVLQSELETLRALGKGSVLSLRLDAVVVYGNPSSGDVAVIDKIRGLEFTEDAKEMKQGDKFMEVTLPFIALRVQNQS
ncbi:MAG: hypothetical protein PHX39_05285 [Bacteroidales bacterium]|nr:hypothetical protein [Bacteroidales bacterium]MDD4178190.1 hypothetical protein [Bacteroidales bacterium]NCU36128.1 hypothetical protein [Candidatus Falkowbacteria bacterium]